MSTFDTPAGDVSVKFDGPASAPAWLVLAHGAGADMSHPFMETVAADLGARGIRVCRFNFVYMEMGRKAPDRQPVLEQTYLSVVRRVREESGRARLFAGGKSMGGRIASHVSALGEPLDGLVFLGYPLHPPGRPERIRDAHLPDVTAPMLFVEGTRDPFCPLETLDTVLERLDTPTEVAVIEDGDHSFKVPKSSGRTSKEALTEVVEVVAGWIATRL